MKPRRDNEKGQAAVELAFIVLFLALIALGAVQFAVLYSIKLKVEHAARVGARYAARMAVQVPDSTIQEHTVAAAPDLTGPALTTANVAVSAPSRTAGQPVVVTVTYAYTPVVPIISSLLPRPMTLRGSVQMRIEG